MSDREDEAVSMPPPPRPRRGPSGLPRPPALPPSKGRWLADWWRGHWWRRVAVVVLVLVVGYALYFWVIRRVVVPQNHVLVLLKKNGSRSLPGDQVIIPRPPAKGTADYEAWVRDYGDCNGILEQVYPEGTYFAFSPFDYEREVIDISGEGSHSDDEGSEEGDGAKVRTVAIIPSGKVGVVFKKFGRNRLGAGQVLADPDRDQPGPLPLLLQPGRYNQYANPYAYDIRLVDPLQIDPGFRGVVTVMAGQRPASPNEYLVRPGEQGVQKATEPEGFRYVNPFEKRVAPITILSQRFEMSGADAIRFPSADSFEIQLEGFVEWSVDPDKLPLIYVQYGEGGELVPFLEEKVILPYARSFCRLAGSQYSARDFISGDTKLKFQTEFEQKLREACGREGIVVKQALVRNIEPPLAIKQPINEREIAREQILQYEQQIKVAQSQAKLVTQEETANQNQAIGDANKQVVTVTKAAEQKRDVSVTESQRDLAVAKLRLQAAEKQAEAVVARGQAEASVVLLKRQAEAEPLRQQVAAFGGGDGYARYFFYQQVAPAMKSILTSSDGPFADLFRQFAAPPRPGSEAKPGDRNGAKVTGTREAGE